MTRRTVWPTVGSIRSTTLVVDDSPMTVDPARPMSMAERLALAKLEARVGSVAASLVVGHRYAVVEVLGRGGMGEVVRARDRALDRDVALKCLRADLGAAWSGSDCGDEARALARVVHPNVVPVFDIVTDPIGVFVVMECIDGVDLRRWAGGGARPWREVIAVMIQAARGLAAVHAAGLVHGDVKPDNVLVASDGRARVVDFGLSRVQAWQCGRDETDPGLDDGTRQLGIRGTLGYLAPEQYDGRPADACSDQLAFCLTLFEALYGLRAVAPDVLERARGDARAWSLRERPRDRGVPPRLHAVIARGASARRSDRFPDMASLVAALVVAAGPRAARRRVAPWAVLAGAAVIAVLAARETRPAGGSESASDRPPRVHEIERLRGLDRAEQLADAGDPTAARRRVLAEADLLRADGDITTALEAELLAANLAVELGDYDAALAELPATYYGALESRADAVAFHAAIEIAALLAHRLARPDDAEVWLRHARAALDPAAVVDVARLAVADADLLQLRARYPEAIGRLAAAVQVLERAGEIDAGHLAGARNDLGLALETAGEHDRAVVQLELALALSVRVYGEDHGALARVLGNLGMALASAGRIEDAVDAHRRALAIRERTYGPDHPDVAASLTSLGSLHAASGRTQTAEQHYLRALAIQERSLAADHPAIAVTLNNLANLAREPAQAAAWYERALAIGERAHGPAHPQVAIVASNLAIALADLDRLDEAHALLERSLAIRERVFGSDHEQTAYALHNLGVIDHLRGRSQAALARLEPALRIRERGRDPLLLASTRMALAEALFASGGDPLRARTLAAAARTSFLAAQRTDDLAQADALLLALG